MILIEGPDGSGKSTLAKKLCLEKNWLIIHSPGQIEHTAVLEERKFWYFL